MIVNTAFRQVIDESKGNCGICGDSIQKTIGHLELECGCVTHYACFVEYIKSKSSLEIGRYNGVLCPYFVTGECKYIGEYFFNTSYFHFLVEYYDENFTPEQSSNDAMSTRFTSDDCERICSWVNTDTSGADVNTGRQLNPYVEVTTKACPKCTTRISHFAGHGCHHVMGCPTCNEHWCYQCGCSESENTLTRGDRKACLCGSWSTFCRVAADVIQYIEKLPYPHDRRCGCPVCPECRYGQPCGACTGECAVCLGYCNHGPEVLMGDDWVAATSHVSDAIALVQLMGAILSHDHATARHLLDMSSRLVNMPDQSNNGVTVLHMACFANNIEAVEMILEIPTVDVNARCQSGSTPLHKAAMQAGPEVVAILMSHPACDVNCADEKGQTPLMIASTRIENAAMAVGALLHHPSIDVNTPDRRGMTALLHAITRNDLEGSNVMQLLLNCELLNMDYRFPEDRLTALLFSVKFNFTISAVCLLSHLKKSRERLFDETDGEGLTSLMHACRCGNGKVLRAILRLAGDDESGKTFLNKKDQQGLTALHYALRGCDIEEVKLLVDLPYVDVNARCAKNCVPFDIALAKKSDELGSLLLERADITTYLMYLNITRESELIYCCKYGMEKTVRALVSKPQVKLDYRDKQDMSAIDHAIRGGHLSIIQILLPLTRHSSCIGRDGRTLFMHLCRGGVGPICRKGHMMEPVEGTRRWACDGRLSSEGCVCGSGLNRMVLHTQRYRCSEGCNFNYCEPCVLKHFGGSERSEAILKATLEKASCYELFCETDRTGMTPLMHAVAAANKCALDILLSQCFDSSLILYGSFAGKSALSIAIGCGKYDIASQLVEFMHRLGRSQIKEMNAHFDADLTCIRDTIQTVMESAVELFPVFMKVEDIDTRHDEESFHSGGYVLTAKLFEGVSTATIDIVVEFPHPVVYLHSDIFIPLVRFMTPVVHYSHTTLSSEDGFLPPSLFASDASLSFTAEKSSLADQLNHLLTQLAGIAEHNLRIMEPAPTTTTTASMLSHAMNEISSPLYSSLGCPPTPSSTSHALEIDISYSSATPLLCRDPADRSIEWNSPLDATVACRLRWPGESDNERGEPAGDVSTMALVTSAARAASANPSQYQLFMCSLQSSELGSDSSALTCIHCNKPKTTFASPDSISWENLVEINFNPDDSHICKAVKRLTREALVENNSAAVSCILAHLVQVVTTQATSLHLIEYHHVAVVAAHVFLNTEAELGTIHLRRSAAILLMVLYQRAVASGPESTLLVTWLHRMGVCRHRVALSTSVQTECSEAPLPPMLVSLLEMTTPAHEAQMIS